jgi:hypothetical protein
VVAGYYLGDLSAGLWLDQWRPEEGERRAWLMKLAGVGDFGDSRGGYVASHCGLRKVFYGNTGPKRRDIEVYECEPDVLVQGDGGD